MPAVVDPGPGSAGSPPGVYPWTAFDLSVAEVELDGEGKRKLTVVDWLFGATNGSAGGA